MICEKCGGTVETVTCAGCGTAVLRMGPYCYGCGQRLALPVEAAAETEPPDIADRVLCSDGACIGVVDEKGFCKVCGKAYTPEV